jgi:hypothetical protein
MKKVILMSALLSLAIMSCKKNDDATPQNDVLPANAVGRYFTSVGAIGTPIEAKFLGGITKTANHKGVADAAWQFDGVDDRIEIADDAKFKPAAFTLAMRATTQEASSRILAFASKGKPDYYLAGELRLFGAVYDANNNRSQTSSNDNLLDNKWYHLTMTADSDSIKLYVDGIKKASRATKFNIKTSASPLYLGYVDLDNVDSGEAFFHKGKITDFVFYGKVLTDAEILNISK